MTPDRAGVRVAPALSVEEWATAMYASSGDAVRMIALLNDALPAASPYRVTRAMVQALGDFVPGLMTVQAGMMSSTARELIALHAALEALLRPSDG